MRSPRTLVLRWTFSAGIVWAALLLFGERLSVLWSLNPAPEGHRWHDAWETLAPLVLVAGGGLLGVLLLRPWPRFLRVPEAVTPAYLATRAVLYAPLVFGTLAVLFFCAWSLFVVPGEDPEHSQSGLSALFAAVFFPVALTPSLTVVSVWLSALPKERGGTP